MDKYALVSGQIKAGAVNRHGWVFAPANFAIKSGSAPMLLEHSQDNNIIFNRAAQWTIDNSGLTIRHWLGLARHPERAIYDRVCEGRLHFSFGRGRSVAASQAAVARTMKVKPLTRPRTSSLPVEHVSYVLRPSYHQEPARIIKVI